MSNKRKGGKSKAIAPVHAYWDSTLQAWVKVYPMNATRTYMKRTSSTWASKSGRVKGHAGASFKARGR